MATPNRKDMLGTTESTSSHSMQESEIPVPESLAVSSITASSARISWQVSTEIQKTPHSFLVSYQSEGTEPKSISTRICHVLLSDLKPGTDYTVDVYIELQHGGKSNPASVEMTTATNYTVRVYTEIKHGGKSQPASVQMRTGRESASTRVPETLAVSAITASSARISWQVPTEMQKTPHSFLVSYQSEGTEPKTIATKICHVLLSSLSQATDYTIDVYIELENEDKSQLASIQMRTTLEMQKTPHSLMASHQTEGTEPPAISTDLSWTDRHVSVPTTTALPVPGNLTVEPHYWGVTVKWTKPEGVDQVAYLLELFREDQKINPRTFDTDYVQTDISDLQHGSKYTVHLYTKTNNSQSKPISKEFTYEVPVPEGVTLSSITASSARVSWQVPTEMQKTPHSFLVSYRSEGTEPKSISTESCSTDITDLKPGTDYTITICTVLQPDGGDNQLANFKIKTGFSLSELLSSLGLRDLQGGKLTLSSVLEINSNTLSDTPPQGLRELPWSFLKKLIMSNLNARNEQCTQDQPICNSGFIEHDDDANAMNPLDLVTALFHCADPFLQQEMVCKMSLCQFAVPFLLPNSDTQQSTLMLWAMRDLVKNFKPHSSSGEGAFVEDRIVDINIPMVSFVKVGESSLSKSQILNDLLSNPSQSNRPFIHRNMECGDVPRRISNGLVEVSWCLPCGKKNIDIFTQPVVVVNLRGDSRMFEAQVSFLCQTSAAVFIFSDDLEGDLSPFTNNERKAELFLVTNSQRKDYDVEKLKETCLKHGFEEDHVVVRKKQNDSHFVNVLRSHVKYTLDKKTMKTNIFNMAGVARQTKLLVDEDSDECQNARQYAEEISKMVEDVVAFKEEQLPLHGNLWKEISQLEKERYRMREAEPGVKIEDYKDSLTKKEKKLRKEQQQRDVSVAMVKFIAGISKQNTERLYFIKWLKIQLDNLTRKNLATLREIYKDYCKTPENKELIQEFDDKISNCSLGPEHFFRELGQIYECACSLPQDDPARQQVQHLPGLCAQMLLDGFPVELVDGDASNIPIKWISDVLTQLHQLVETRSRILVLTVLGVQSTGKSTLLNTMFGVQFAVSSGRCTRGAFMLLMKVSEELRAELKCDFIMVIDTEGLKSPELATLDTSYEHDNELATLVIGLSDITIINVAMENNQEMKDVLQIAVHAFLRMKEVGKKPRCLFVHQNVSDMSAHDKNMRDRKKLVEQLNEMTQAAAKMERKEANSKFTDVMKYDPENDSYYIPGLWHGTPPMAPVNTGYSEAVYELKKNLIDLMKSNVMINNESVVETSNNATDFMAWTKSLWSAVKYENFIFNFKNSLVADAYSDLCTNYKSWEWTFQSEMNKWLIAKTTVISNFGVTDKNVQISKLQATLTNIKVDASVKLNKEIQTILDNLQQYFQKKDNKVRLVEKYRQEFQKSVNFLKRETEHSVRQCLEQAAEIRKGMEKVNTIKDQQTDTIETNVVKLIEECRKRGTDLSEDDLKAEFDKMWTGIMSELSNITLQQTDVHQNAVLLLMGNLKGKSGQISEMLSKVDLKTSGQGTFTVQGDWFSGFKNSAKQLWNKKAFITKRQAICNQIIEDCHITVEDHINTMRKDNTDYNDTYIKELLNHIDDQMKDQEISDVCEATLKFHIVGYAIDQFQVAHNEYNAHNNPQEHLKQSKNTFLDNFLASFNEKDQCLKKAQLFTETCVKIAVQNYISKHLGQAIANEMKTGDEGVIYNTRTNLQFAVLKQLLQEKSFEKYKKYTTSYEKFVKNWIKQQTIERMSTRGWLPQLEKQLLSDIVVKINAAITSSVGTSDIKEFIQQFCSSLEDQLTIPRDALDNFMILISVNTEQFSTNLKELIKYMETSLSQEYGGRIGRPHITKRIEQLPSKPYDLLFSSVCGCGQQCPFCRAPCEAGGGGHTTHFSSMHRPRAFGHRVWNDSNKLIADICTTAVISNIRFRSSKTNGEWHPYKEYREIYPDWDIAGDVSVEASDYWKYVLKEFNTELANAYSAEPADIPDGWNELTEQDALTGLMTSFNIKIQCNNMSGM